MNDHGSVLDLSRLERKKIFFFFAYLVSSFLFVRTNLFGDDCFRIWWVFGLVSDEGEEVDMIVVVACYLDSGVSTI